MATVRLISEDSPALEPEPEAEPEVLSDVHVNNDNNIPAKTSRGDNCSSDERSFTRFEVHLLHQGREGTLADDESGDQASHDDDDGVDREDKGSGGTHANSELMLDEDGDLIVSRPRKTEVSSHFITIEHAMKTKLTDVGLQAWQGCLLLCNFILHNQPLFTDCIALELGGGTGLASIVMATIAKLVICTDTGQDILELCERNINANSALYGPTCITGERCDGRIIVRNLDWSSPDLDTDTERRFHWTKEEINLLAEVSVIFAADVIYSNDLTDAFFQILLKLLMLGKATCYIALEKRLNFTLSDLDVTCKEYNHFRVWLRRLQTKHGCAVVQHDVSHLPQYLQCPCSTYLELWEIQADGATAS